MPAACWLLERLLSHSLAAHALAQSLAHLLAQAWAAKTFAKPVLSHTLVAHALAQQVAQLLAHTWVTGDIAKPV